MHGHGLIIKEKNYKPNISSEDCTKLRQIYIAYSKINVSCIHSPADRELYKHHRTAVISIRNLTQKIRTKEFYCSFFELSFLCQLRQRKLKQLISFTKPARVLHNHLKRSKVRNFLA